MPTVLQLRRGTTAEHSSFTGAEGEVTVNTTKDTLVVHDGSTAGGFEVALADLSNTSAIALTDISAGTGVTYNNSTGVISIGQAVGTGDSVTFAGVTAPLTGNVTGDLTGTASNATTAVTLTGLTSTITELNYVDGVTSNIQTQLDAKAPLASPALTGTPTAPTATAGANTTQIATTAFVATAVANIIDSAPGALDTLNELAAALGDDANFSTTVTNSIATKLNASAVSAFGLTLVDDADAATARTTLGLGTAATTASTDYATAAQGATADSAVQNLGDLGITSTAAELNTLDGFTGVVADLNYAKDLRATGVTSTEFDYLDGVTSAIQTQLDAKLASSSYTAADVLTKIKTVDGASSGLDADLLDGQQGTYYRINIYNSAGTLLN